MRGDFSKWGTDLKQNYNGLLQQQGRVFLDNDWNEQVRISEDRRQTMLRDVVGANIVAIPAELPESMKITKSEVTADKKIWLDMNAGRAWINGVSLDSAANQHLTASYLSSSIGTVDDIGDGIRDAVILELWQEELNSFQDPEQLLESALGGPDTTEKIHTGMALRLLRLEKDEHCRNIKDKIAAEDKDKGKLIVTLKPNSAPPAECPEVETGGYAGFEHNLYRIEIAHANQAPVKAKFKWSTVNGGLVGRGTYDASDSLHKKIILTANQPAIVNSQKDNFYLEIIEMDDEAGRTNVTYGAEATLNGNVLELGVEHYVTSAPKTTEVFFRLWDGIKLISEFPKTGDAKELKHGIRLAFDDEASMNYRPADYWNFDVRVGQKHSATPLIDNKAPLGIVYHRAPLGILNWDADKTITFAEDQIDDCRHIFRPLTKQNVCCTYIIGDGKSSQGDFNDFNLALKHLPKTGGQLCLLPGVHKFNAVLNGKKNIRITGCGLRTIVHPDPDKKSEPVFEVNDSQNIQIDGLTIVSTTGVTIKMSTTKGSKSPLRNIEINDNRIVSCHTAITIFDGNYVRIQNNNLSVIDKKKGLNVVFLKGEDCLIRNNKINVVPDPKKIEEETPGTPGTPGDTPGGTVFDDCDDGLGIYLSDIAIMLFIQLVFFMDVLLILAKAAYIYQAKGGIQIGSSSERITLIGNTIVGGRGHGIALGHLPSAKGEYPNDGAFFFDDFKTELKALMENEFESFLYDIVIKNNIITQMGQNGISTAVFFGMEKLNFLMSLKDLEIIGNKITRCAQNLVLTPANGIAGTAAVSMDQAHGGVILADAEDVIIRENRIEQNGLSHLQAICGIWIGQGEKIEISDNRIIDNAPRTSLKDEAAAKGWRGGIVIRLSLNKIMKDVLDLLSTDTPEMFQDSLPAAKIHDNTVVQPLGQALIIMAMGPVSVANNHFTSQGTVNVVSDNIISEMKKLDYDYIALMGATVIIANLGISKDIFPLVMLGSFAQLGKMSIGNEYMEERKMSMDNFSDATGESSEAVPEMGALDNFGMTKFIDIAGLNLASLLYLPSGQIMFNDNRTTLDLRAPSMSLLLSSQTMISLDDISFANNQSEIASVLKLSISGFTPGALPNITTEMDIAGNNTVLMAFTVRATNNRFQEGLTQGIPQKGFSLFSYGMMNTTMGNQATNCLLPLGPAIFNYKFGNTVLFHQRCKDMTARLISRFQLKKIIKKVRI